MPHAAGPTAITLLATALVGAASADDVFLRGGGRLTGVIVERTGDTVVVETGPGRVTLSLSRVERIVEGRSALEGYRERAAAVAPGDAQGWADLARWASERDLLTQSREAWQRALAADPTLPEANAALGRVQLDGVWMGTDDAYRARGYVEFEGRWVTPAEHEALVRERAFEEETERQRREAELRVREAEARAREAEARAREAEAAAQQQGVDEGIPLWWGWGWGGGGYLPPVGTWPPESRPPHPPGQSHRPGQSHPSGPPAGPTPAPRPTTQPSPPPQAPPHKPAGIPLAPFPRARED
jgi:hypothetical protein